MERRSVVFDLFHTLVDPEAFRPKDHRRAEIVADMIGADPQVFASYWTNTLPTRLTSSKTVLQLLEEYHLSRTGKKCPRTNWRARTTNGDGIRTLQSCDRDPP